MSFGMEGRPVGRLVRAQYNIWSYHKKTGAPCRCIATVMTEQYSKRKS